ncbi:hypothetical protein M8J77_010893 [Diaphorina citri]|nr:hypothetical protein M8J77_010893 [Diaphorina citri]
MGLGRFIQLALAILVVLCLHIGVNIINRVILEVCYYQQDADKMALNCSFLVFLVLFLMLQARPKHFGRYCCILVCAELLLQLLYLCWFLKLHYLLMCDLIPSLDNSWLGGLAVYKFLLLLLILYVLWFHVLGAVECKIKWDSDDCGDPSESDCEPEPSSCYSDGRGYYSEGRSCSEPPREDSCSYPRSPPRKSRSSGDC